MADLNFPNPGVQTTYTFVGKTWNWDGQRWAFVSSGSGITKLNDLTASVQNFLIGYSGTFPNIVSSGSDHTFNFPIAGIAATGLVNTSAQTFAGAKTFASTTNATFIGEAGVVVHGGIAISGNAAVGGSAIFTNTTNTNTIAFRAGVQGSTLTYILPIDTPTSGQVLSASAPSSGVVTLSWEDDQTGAPAGGITQLNGLTAATQSFQTGTAGNDFNISSLTSTHTFNIPDASSSARGLVTTGSQTIAGAKTFSSSIISNLTGTATTSENVNVTTTTRSLTHYLTFTNASSGSGLALTTSTIGIGFTVNPAQNTLAAGTFIGNVSGTAVTATNFYGTLTGNVTGTATTAQNVNVTTTTLSNNFYLTFANASSGSGLALTTSAVGMGLTYNPATNTLSAQFFTGTAFTARNTEVTTTTRSVDHYLLFANASSGTGLGLSTSAVGMGLTYNPATNTLSAQFFTGTATTARNIDVTTTTRSLTHYLTFTNASSGSGVALTTSTIGIGFTVNPAQNTLAAGTFIGNLSGTAVTATNFYGSLVGTATTSQNVNTTAADSSGNHYLIFSPVNVTASGVALSSDSGLSFVPSTNVLSTNVFSGNLSATGATVTTIFNAQGDVSLGDATGDTVTFNARIGSHFNPTTNSNYDFGLNTLAWRNAFIDNITGTAITATNFYGTLTGNVTGTATTSQNVNITTTTRSTDHYLVFTNATNGSGLALTTSAVGMGLTYNPATNTLSAQFFTGTATTTRNIVVNTTTRSANHYLLFSPDSSGSGVALTTSTVGMGLTYNPATNTLSAQFFTGTATTSRNIDVTTTTAGGNFYLTFTNASSGSGLALTTSTIGTGFTVNPAQNTLAAGTFVGNVSGSATTSTYITGILRNASYVLGDLLAGASTGNTLTRVPIGPNERYFLKPDSSTQSGLGWSTFAGVFVTSLAPASPAFTLVEGDLWYKVDDGSFNVYYTDVDDTAQWVEIVSSGGGTGGGGTPAGSNTYVQFNDSNAFGGVADFTFAKNTPKLSIKNFPTESPSGSTAALELLGPSVTFSGSNNGTFIAINSASGFAGYMIDARKNGTTQFSVNNDGSTYVATLNSNGTVYSNTGVLTNTNPSDENLKENIQSMIGGIVYINQLNPVSFEWKSGVGGTGTKYGFIAQEVQQVIPDVVSTDPLGTIGIDTVSLIPFLVKSIKEQQETIEQLRAEIQFIKTELGI